MIFGADWSRKNSHEPTTTMGGPRSHLPGPVPVRNVGKSYQLLVSCVNTEIGITEVLHSGPIMP